jgi:hypothetical protein
MPFNTWREFLEALPQDLSDLIIGHACERYIHITERQSIRNPGIGYIMRDFEKKLLDPNQLYEGIIWKYQQGLQKMNAISRFDIYRNKKYVTKRSFKIQAQLYLKNSFKQTISQYLLCYLRYRDPKCKVNGNKYVRTHGFGIEGDFDHITGNDKWRSYEEQKRLERDRWQPY